jgi:hypothetical protein
MCLECPMFPVSMDCPFLISPSVFSNIYLNILLQYICILVFWFLCTPTSTINMKSLNNNSRSSKTLSINLANGSPTSDYFQDLSHNIVQVWTHVWSKMSKGDLAHLTWL